jgi:ATP-dependent helicase/nuclease subunit B
MREVLEEPEKTAALITPDRQLAEAVIAALQRWGIDADDSAGRPLSECGAGGFLMLLVRMIAEDFAPLSALGFLKHPRAAGGMAPADFRKKVRDLERKIWRGYRPAPGIDGILSCLEPGSDLHVFVDRHIAVPLADLCAIWTNAVPTLSSLAGALGGAAERMASCRQLEDGRIDEADGAARAWWGDDGRAAADLLSAMVAQGESFEADTASFPHILKTLMDGKTVRPSWPAHPRLSILGPVEARMQSADRLIIGGFNEGNWPPRPETDPWMNAEMRQSAGLSPHNWRSGLSAHDVWMAVCTPDVIVTRALRDGDVVTTPSRWLQRLEAVLAALQITDALDRGDVLKARMSMLAPVPPLVPVGRPAPCPPISARPRTFSATEIDDWISDPYSIYAKRILGLRPLDEIDRAPDAALRGNIVHDALAAFIKAHPKGPLGSDALAELRAFGRRCFEPFWQISSVRVFWWPAFELMSAWFIETEGRRRADLAHSHVEIDGDIPIEAPAGPAAVKARADRIDQMQDGGLAVLDYKTGSVPTVSEVEAGRRTQLLTEAVIAAHGGFAGIDAASVIAMQYWKLAGRRDEAGRIVNVMPDGWTADAARDSLAALFTSFDNPATAYASLPDPSVRLPFARYDHLSRVDEWLPAASAQAGCGQHRGSGRRSGSSITNCRRRRPE